MWGPKFGTFVRWKRIVRTIGLRQSTKEIGVSPTYLSKVERGEFTPQTKDKGPGVNPALWPKPYARSVLRAVAAFGHRPSNSARAKRFCSRQRKLHGSNRAERPFAHPQHAAGTLQHR